MNMKKTIAAAAAGAMAVSATATAASAATATTTEMQQQGTYVYSLVKNFAKSENGTATIQSEKTILLGGGAIANAGASAIYINLRDYNIGALSGTATYKDADQLAWVDVNTEASQTLQVYSTNDNSVLTNLTFQLDGDGRNFDGDAANGVTIHRTGNTYKTTKTATNYGTASDIEVNSQILANRAVTSVLVRFKTEISHKVEKSASLVNLINKNTDFLAIDEMVETTADTYISTMLGSAVDNETEYASAYSIFATTVYTGSNVTLRIPTNFKAYGAYTKYVSAPMLSNTNTTRYNANGVPNIINYLEGYDALTPNGSLNGYYALQGTANSFPVADSSDITVRSWQYIGSSLNTEWDAKWSGTEALSHTKDYTNVMALLNDTIANYDVKFTFNTAAQPVMDSDDGDITADRPGGSYNVDKGDSRYKSFSQHLYGGYGNDPLETAPFGAAYWNTPISYNLFSGALIVNDYYSMQLADTEVFSYSLTALTFDYSALKAKAQYNYNSWMDYVQSLRLATSAEWYWDNLSIEWAAPVADTAESGEGLESDDVTLEDDVPADAGEEEVVVVPEEETPVAPAPNPATGNSAVALAVIPVALAAAAIVAKKRK
jgi:hypothetical protein